MGFNVPVGVDEVLGALMKAANWPRRLWTTWLFRILEVAERRGGCVGPGDVDAPPSFIAELSRLSVVKIEVRGFLRREVRLCTTVGLRDLGIERVANEVVGELRHGCYLAVKGEHGHVYLMIRCRSNGRESSSRVCDFTQYPCELVIDYLVRSGSITGEVAEYLKARAWEMLQAKAQQVRPRQSHSGLSINDLLEAMRRRYMGVAEGNSTTYEEPY